MLKYLKAAFKVRQRIPLLGDVPVNLIAIPVFLALSIIHPAFLLIGLGFEVLLLWTLSSSKRFRNVIDAGEFASSHNEKLKEREKLEKRLTSIGQSRLNALHKKIVATIENYHELGAPDYIMDPKQVIVTGK